MLAYAEPVGNNFNTYLIIMARSRGKRGRSADNKSLIIIAIVVAVVIVGAIVFKGYSSDSQENIDTFAVKQGTRDGSSSGGNSPVELYVKRGSSAVGNTYKFPATVVDVDSHGGSRIIQVTTQDNTRIGLFVPAGTNLKANVRAGMDYVFTVQGRNGTMPDGKPVKGILVVTQAESK